MGHKLPEQLILVTDNGPAMKASWFRNFVKEDFLAALGPAPAALALENRELDDHNGVPRCQWDQGHQTDLEIDIVFKAARPDGE